MTEEQIALTRRAVACRGWKWIPGMRALPCSSDRTGVRGIPVRVVNVYGSDGLAVWGDISGVQGSWEEWRWREEGRLPDLTDPATLGCLLALVREAWGQPLVSVRWSVHGWRVLNTEGRAWCWRIGKGSTEAEALVAALEAAPKQGEHRREEER